MPIARIGNVILYFAHIPKSGGSGIESYLASRGRVCLVAKRATGFSVNTPQHMDRETFESYVPTGFYDHGFAILRDPLARLQSEYRHQIRLSKRRGRVASRLIDLAAWRAPGGFDKQAECHVLSRDFDAWVQLVLHACASDPYIMDGHIRPQVDYVHPSHVLFDLRYGLGPVIRWIDTVAGLAQVCHTAPHEKRAPQIPLTLSPGTQKMVARFYRKDADLLARIGGEHATVMRNPATATGA